MVGGVVEMPEFVWPIDLSDPLKAFSPRAAVPSDPRGEDERMQLLKGFGREPRKRLCVMSHGTFKEHDDWRR